MATAAAPRTHRRPGLAWHLPNGLRNRHGLVCRPAHHGPGAGRANPAKWVREILARWGGR